MLNCVSNASHVTHVTDHSLFAKTTCIHIVQYLTSKLLYIAAAIAFVIISTKK